jgi:hypothetical protein
LKVLEEEGVSPDEVLTGTGLSNKDLSDFKTLLSIEQLVRIYANIAKGSKFFHITMEFGVTLYKRLLTLVKPFVFLISILMWLGQ